MPKQRKNKLPVGEREPESELAEKIKNISGNLRYMSETDAEIRFFEGGPVDAVNKDSLLAQIGKPGGAWIEERDFAETFKRLTKIEEWYGDEEKESARKFAALRDVLQQNLRDLRVFKIGRIEKDVYIVGLDEAGTLVGVETKAVET